MINCQKRTYGFWHLIESSNNGILGIIKTLDQVPKKNGRIFSLDRKLKITQNDINKTFDQLKTLKKFDQVKKHNFDQMPKLLKISIKWFDQVKFDQVIVSLLLFYRDLRNNCVFLDISLFLKIVNLHNDSFFPDESFEK